MLKSSDINRFARRALRWVRRKLWWSRIVLPVALIVFVLTWFTQIVYSGQTHMRLASYAENYLITFSLKLAAAMQPLESEPLGDELIVSVPDSSSLLQTFGEKDSRDKPLVRDIPLAVYQKLFEKAKQLKAKGIAFNFMPSIYSDAKPELEAFLTELSNPPDNMQVLLAIPPSDDWAIPAKFRDAPFIVSNQPCDEFSEIQLACPLNPNNASFDDWILQKLILKSGMDYEQLRSQNKISETIARTHPSYLMALPNEANLPKILADDFLADSFRIPLDKTWLFVGSSAVQPSNVKSNDAIRRVWTIQNSMHGTLAKDGTPLHVFWAQTFSMFVSGKLVVVTKESINMWFTILFCISIVLLLIRFDEISALAGFIGFVILAPFINGLAVCYLSIYTPLFDLYYAGFATFLFVSFGQLSKESYARWVLEERQRLLTKTADLKANFISMVSHNLNTPIAKIQGMLGLLLKSDLSAEIKTAFVQASRVTTEMQMTIKCQLLNLAIDEHGIAQDTKTLEAAAFDLKNSLEPLCHQLGFDLWMDVEDLRSQKNLPDSLPVKIDGRLVNYTTAALMCLMRDRFKCLDWVVYCEPETSDQAALNLTLQTSFEPGAVTQPDIDDWRLLVGTPDSQSPHSFYIATLRRLIGKLLDQPWFALHTKLDAESIKILIKFSELR